MKIILASKSPRRHELLAKIVPSFDVVESFAEENIEKCEPHIFVMRLAQKKALKVAEYHKDCIVIGADTTVYKDGEFYEKPKDETDARRILKELSGKTHFVYSGVCVVLGDKILTGYEKSSVTFLELSDEFITNYIISKIPMDKAGAYGIQEKNSPVKSFEGEFENIMGLPLKLTKTLLVQIDPEFDLIIVN